MARGFIPVWLRSRGERSGSFRIGQYDLLVSREGRSWITFADYAIAMLDEVEAPKHSRQRFTVGY